MGSYQNGKKVVPKVVVVGGGFAGIAAVQALRKSGAHCDITVVSKSETFEYYPALYKLVTGALAIEVSVPLRKIKGFSSVTIEKALFTSVDPERQVIAVEKEGVGQDIPYDYLVLALGSETNYFNIPGLDTLSLSFKSVREAFRLKRHFCDLFAVTMSLSKDEAVAKLHTVVVGGGPSGVELAGDLTHYLRSLATSFSVDPSLVTVDLIEAGTRILPMMSETVSALATTRLRMMGVNIYTNRAVANQDVLGVSMGNMNFQSNTVIWTAGTRINSAYTKIPGVTFDERRRVVVDEHLALAGHNHIFVIGDGAATPHSGLAQTAMHDGRYLGRAVARMIKGKTPKRYKPHAVSYIIPIGNEWAIFVSGKLTLKGFIPWIMRSAADFRYFLSIVPLWYVFEVFRQGAKYRRSKTYCPTE